VSSASPLFSYSISNTTSSIRKLELAYGHHSHPRLWSSLSPSPVVITLTLALTKEWKLII
jgi:hypothetical protein